jgi:hypothetical protein
MDPYLCYDRLRKNKYSEKERGVTSVVTNHTAYGRYFEDFGREMENMFHPWIQFEMPNTGGLDEME